jgi:hypothetical protein
MVSWVTWRAARKLFLKGTAGHSLIRTSLVTALAGVLLLISPGPAGAQGPASLSEPIVVASSVDPRVPPALAVARGGALRLIWQEPGARPDATRLVIATRPYTSSTVLADVTVSAQSASLSTGWLSPAIAPGEQQSVAWTNGTAPDSSIFARTSGTELVTWQPGKVARWAFTMDPTGALSVAWWSEHTLVVEQPAVGSVISFAVAPDRAVDQIRLVYGSGGQGYLAWSLTASAGQSAGVWYVSLAEGADPVEAAPAGLLKAAAVDGSGTLYLAWATDEGLWYCSSAEPAAPQLVRAEVALQAQVALAAGPDGQAHLVWEEAGALRYARSTDWSVSLTALPAVDALSVVVAVDARNRAHIAWTEQAPESAPRLLLLEPPEPTPMIAVTAPQPGGTVGPEVRAQVTTNLSPDAWERLTFYLQPVDERGDQAPLMEVGIDDDGTDGWSVPLVAALTRQSVRVAVIGQDRQGRVARAVGEPFTLVPADQPAVWVEAAPGEDAAGVVQLIMSNAPGWDQVDDADLFLLPAGTTHSTEHEGVTGTPAIYAGRMSLSAGQSGSRLSLDSRAVSDGTYTIRLSAATSQGESFTAVSAGSVTIDNTRAPQVNAVLWSVGLPAGEIGLIAELADSHRAPEQVDFYLQSVTESVAGQAPDLAGELVRVGSDTDPQDGWSVTARVAPEWQDAAWVGWAIACDVRQLCGTAATGSRILSGTDSPALWPVYPSAASPLYGEVPFGLYGDHSLYQVLRAQAFIQSDDGMLETLGDLRWSGRGWQGSWDTRARPDGHYRLLVLASLMSGSQLSLWSEPLIVANRTAGWKLSILPEASPVSGEIGVSLANEVAFPAVQNVTFYVRTTAGSVLPVGEGIWQQSRWAAIWNTYEVTNGSYTLTAAIRGEDGALRLVEEPIEVRNGEIQVDFLRAPAQEPVRRINAVAWRSLPATIGTQLTLDYSPDGGSTWVPLAHGLGPSGSATWDSQTVADTDQAYLRLQASDGEHVSVALHGPFVVDNENEAPAVTLLWPVEGDTLSGTTGVRWAGGDSDGDDVQVELLVRQGEGAWVPLARALPVEGEYPWDTGASSPGASYTVKAVARDSRGATSIDVVQGLSIVDNLAPSVSLLWPREPTTLQSSAVILWRTNDPEGDRLIIDLYYSDNDGLTWSPLADNLDDVGYFVWEVSFLPPGVAYRVKVVAQDRYHASHDESQGLIAAQGQGLPAVHMVEPLAGSSVHSVLRLGWQPATPTGERVTADVLLRAVGEIEWRTLASGLSRTNQWMWDTTGVSDGLYELAVRLRRGDERSVSGVTTGVRVSNAEMLSGWQVVRWLSPNIVLGTQTTIEQSSNGGETWQTVTAVPAADGTYLWNTDAWPPGDRYLLRASVTGADGEIRTATSGRLALGGRGLLPPRLQTSAQTNAGATRGRITWDAQDADGDAVSVSLALCSEAGTDCMTVPGVYAAAGEHTLGQTVLDRGSGLTRIVADDGLYRVEGLVQWQAVDRRAEGLTLNVLSPAGDREWPGSVPVTWDATEASDEPVSIDLEYSSDGGQTWELIISDVANVGRYLWQTTLVPNGTYRVRVTARSGERVVAQESAAFVLDRVGRNAPISSLALDGGSPGQTGSHALVWRSTDRDADQPVSRVEYGLSALGPWYALAEGFSAPVWAGWASQALPNAPVWMRLVASDGVFETASIPVGPEVIHHASAPRVRILSPMGGERWGEAASVAWAVTGESVRVTVTLMLSLDGGRSWDTLGTGLPAVGSLDWDPESVPAGSRVLIRALARSGGTFGTAQNSQPVITGDTISVFSSGGTTP